MTPAGKSTTNIKYELVYWKGICGRSEGIRALFAILGIDYTYTGVTFAEWPEYKPSTKRGQLPMLRIRDAATDELLEEIGESTSIERLLAKRYGIINVDSDEELAEIEAARSDMEYVLTRFWDYNVGPDGFAKTEVALGMFNKAATSFASFHEKLLANNSNGNGHYVGDKITIADIGLVIMVKFLRKAGNGDAFTAENAPLINKVVETLTSSNELKEYFVGLDERLAIGGF
ncbi:hypothetical protein GQ42DRAFT_164985 [Ramicandelaber brevisporus]|nr:hypothetical protein GQ42DRAFT_164985 [Ramicandelaber brevisporus]